jgi:hypothetical protein
VKMSFRSRGGFLRQSNRFVNPDPAFREHPASSSSIVLR